MVVICLSWDFCLHCSITFCWPNIYFFCYIVGTLFYKMCFMHAFSLLGSMFVLNMLHIRNAGKIFWRELRKMSVFERKQRKRKSKSNSNERYLRHIHLKIHAFAVNVIIKNLCSTKKVAHKLYFFIFTTICD